MLGEGAGLTHGTASSMPAPATPRLACRKIPALLAVRFVLCYRCASTPVPRHECVFIYVTPQRICEWALLQISPPQHPKRLFVEQDIPHEKVKKALLSSPPKNWPRARRTRVRFCAVPSSCPPAQASAILWGAWMMCHVMLLQTLTETKRKKNWFCENKEPCFDTCITKHVMTKLHQSKPHRCFLCRCRPVSL